MNDLIVSESVTITGRGVAVFFEKDPDPWLPWQAHRVRVTKPGGESFETVARVEFARKVPPGEILALLFSQRTDVPVGARVAVLGPASADDV